MNVGASQGGGRPLFTVSVAASLTGMHAQTLRQYDRLGLVTPSRAKGRSRRYSQEDVDRLREIQRLSKEQGVNLAGIKLLLDMRDELETLRVEAENLRAILAQAGGPTRGVFTADAEGRVTLRPARKESPSKATAHSGRASRTPETDAGEQGLVPTPPYHYWWYMRHAGLLAPVAQVTAAGNGEPGAQESRD